jgi:hypothetical protein
MNDEDKFLIPIEICDLEGVEEVFNRENINMVFEDGTTPLIHAIINDECDEFSKIIGLLIEKGAQVDLPDEDGAEPLYYAVVHNNNNIINMLLEKGAKATNEILNVAVDNAIVSIQRGDSPISRKVHKKTIMILLDALLKAGVEISPISRKVIGDLDQRTFQTSTR